MQQFQNIEPRRRWRVSNKLAPCVFFWFSLSASMILAGEAIVPRSSSERLEYIGRAETWRPIDTPSLDVLAGPAELLGNKGYHFAENIVCAFVDPDQDSDPFGNGQTPKFHCRTSNGKVIKVKYGLRNPEVYGEVAGTRLLWALGFGSDTNYSVRVQCEDCPRDPWAWITLGASGRARFKAGIRPRDQADRVALESRFARGTQIFLPATVEIKFKGDKIESYPDQG